MGKLGCSAPRFPMANGVFALVCLCAVLGAGKAAAAVAPFLKTRNLGQLVGEQEISEDGTSYYSFKGLRYALPPVGDLRFKVRNPFLKMDLEMKFAMSFTR